MKQAVGMIEVLGFGSLIEVADVCLKTANIKLEGYEKTTGGWGCIKITGDVGAVKASVLSGSEKAKAFGHFIGSTVIARPADGIEPIIRPSMAETAKPEIEESIKPEETISLQKPETETENIMEEADKVSDKEQQNGSDPLKAEKKSKRVPNPKGERQ